jgi:hypothetical protein
MFLGTLAMMLKPFVEFIDTVKNRRPLFID